ncbi:MAG: DUF4147 domain-containing protein [Nitrososphaeria archaeon]|nr:DUF4147 domain-containing protein [Nitrososphaeria archaeon]
MVIKNFDKLNLSLERRIVLEIIEKTLDDVNYYNLVKKYVHLLNDSVLQIKDKLFNLKDFEKIYFIAGGKSSSFMAKAFEEILGEKISEAIVVEKRGYHSVELKFPIIYAGHPLPDNESFNAGKNILSLVKKACEKDLIIVCVSGGWTALTTFPPPTLPFEDVIETYKLLLFSGMPLNQMNVVRNHISMLGKGKLLKHVNGATVLGLIAVDEVGGEPWGPTVKDNTTFKDVLQVLENYNLLDKVPESIRDYVLENLLIENSSSRECELNQARVQNFVLVNNIDLCNIALNYAKDYAPSYVLTTSLEGEAKDVGTVISSIAKEIILYHRPFSPPCILIAGGETTVSIDNEFGEGGRNQELALSTALGIAGTNAILAAIATDGTDGPTEIAGAIVDGSTLSRCKEHGIDLFKELKRHNSSYVWKVLGDAIYTGETGTNLMDLIIIYVP